MPKNGQKMVKSPFGNDILGVEKAYFWVSESTKMAFFKDPEGLKIVNSRKTVKKCQKAIPKVIKKCQKSSKNGQKSNQKPIKNGILEGQKA